MLMNSSNSNSFFDLEEIKFLGRNNWANIISSVSGVGNLGPKHGPCPVCGGNDRFRFDNKNGDGTWYCSHGDGHPGHKLAGDGLSLIVDLNGGNFQEAITAVANYLGIKPKNKNSEPNILTKPMPNVWCSYFSIKEQRIKKCLPVKVWPWATDKDGCDWYLVRTEYQGKKIIYQMKWNPLVNRLEQGTWGDSRPVLGMINTDKVLIVEGATTLDAAKELLAGTDWSVITWEGGTKAINKTDWTCLKDKTVYFFPDNDHDDPANNHHQDSQKAMMRISGLIQGYSGPRFFITPPAKEFHGWDLADAVKVNGWKQPNLLDYIQANSKQITQEMEAEKTLFDFFKPLGYENGDYYFLSYIEQRVIKISSTQFTKEYLLRLATQETWHKFFSDDEGQIRWKSVSGALIAASQAVGPYESSKIRGLGIFQDKKRKVLNLGNTLIVDGEEVSTREFKSKFVYERRASVGFSKVKPLSDQNLQLIKIIVDNFPWEQDVYSDLLLGWLVLAPLCGSLRWRPHVWVTGATGSGKSTILEKLLLSLLDGFTLGVEGETTEAGLRQRINNNAIPIIFEEAEMDSVSSKKIIERNITLARQASTETRTAILKGSQNNQAIEFHLRSMFLFASVVPGISNKADKDRIAILVLDRVKNPKDYELTKEFLRDFEKIKNIAAKFIFFVYSKAEILVHNVEVFSDVISEKYGKRFGDQYGSLIAGRAIFEGDTMHTKDTARKFLLDNKINLEIFNSVAEESQEKDVLSLILEHETRIDFEDRTRTVTIGQLVSMLMAFKQGSEVRGTNESVVKNKLLSIGIKYTKGLMYIATKSKALDKAVGYLNEAGWNKLLERLPAATKVKNPVNFGPGMGRRRAIAVPVELLDLNEVEDDD